MGSEGTHRQPDVHSVPIADKQGPLGRPAAPFDTPGAAALKMRMVLIVISLLQLLEDHLDHGCLIWGHTWQVHKERGHKELIDELFTKGTGRASAECSKVVITPEDQGELGESQEGPGEKEAIAERRHLSGAAAPSGVAGLRQLCRQVSRLSLILFSSPLFPISGHKEAREGICGGSPAGSLAGVSRVEREERMDRGSQGGCNWHGVLKEISLNTRQRPYLLPEALGARLSLSHWETKRNLGARCLDTPAPPSQACRCLLLGAPGTFLDLPIKPTKSLQDNTALGINRAAAGCSSL